MPVPKLPRALVCFLAALILAACSACTFGHAQASPPQSSARTTSPAPTISSSASPTAAGSPVAARVDVDRPGGGQPGVITVTVDPVDPSAGADCGAALWIPFAIDFADHGAGASKQDNEHANLAARVEVRGGNGKAGVFVESGGGDVSGCTGPDTLPASDSFSTMVISGGYHVTTSGYVVVRSGDPTGLTLAITGLQKKPDNIYPPGSWTWQVQRFESGAACPGSPSSICVPLGG